MSIDTSGPTSAAQTAYSVEAYARRASAYDATHTGIFTEQEQARLGETLALAVSKIDSGGRKALNYGCGTGNAAEPETSRVT